MSNDSKATVEHQRGMRWLRQVVLSIRPKQHGMSYQPWLPHTKIIRTRGLVRQTAIVTIWFGWIWEMEIGQNDQVRHPAPTATK